MSCQMFLLLSSVSLMLAFEYGQCFDFDNGDNQRCAGDDSDLQTCDFDDVGCSVEGCAGSPLLLTPYLESGRIQEAQEASRVERICDVTSYSGFFTVDKRHNSNMFFWFFPSADGNASAPLVLWINGGPGLTSLFGLFIENGPFVVRKDLKLITRKYTWTTSHAVLYIDPLGTGYSFTDPGGEETNARQVGCSLYEAFVQFFTLFPQYRNNELYLTGESYAGKYIPAVSYLIHMRNPTATVKINLKGIALGNTFTDPINALNYGDYLYQIGLVDEDGRNVLKGVQRQIIKKIELEQWHDAYDLFDALILGLYHRNSTFFSNLTGFSEFYNFLSTEDTTSHDTLLVTEYLSKPHVRRALHVGERKKIFKIISLEGHRNMEGDIMQSTRPLVEIILEHYKVMFYNGQLDIIEAYPLTEAILNTLCWSGSVAYAIASRTKWHVGNDLAGYCKAAGNLTFLLVRNAGHRVPSDQPAWAHDMISRFTRNQKF